MECTEPSRRGDSTPLLMYGEPFRPALPLVWRPVSLSRSEVQHWPMCSSGTEGFLFPNWAVWPDHDTYLTDSRELLLTLPWHLCCRCSAVRSPRYITSRRAGLAGGGPWQHFCCNCAALSHPLQHLVISEPMSPNNFSVQLCQLWPLMFPGALLVLIS